MSLINEALKKAQKLRAADQAGETAPPMPGAAVRVAKRGQARSSQTIVLIASGAIVLVVLSVVATFWLINRPSPEPARPIASAKPSPEPSASSDSPPLVVAPVITPAPATPARSSPPPETPREAPAAIPTAAPATPGVEPPNAAGASAAPAADTRTAPTSPAPAVAASSVTTNPIPASTSPQPTPPSPGPVPAAPAGGPSASSPSLPSANAPAAAPKFDERIAAYVDSIRVTAIRANDNKVIMNDRVYRVNDLVERTLGIKLIKVAPDSLTFADSNGVTYVKYF